MSQPIKPRTYRHGDAWLTEEGWTNQTYSRPATAAEIRAAGGDPAGAPTGLDPEFASAQVSREEFDKTMATVEGPGVDPATVEALPMPAKASK